MCGRFVQLSSLRTLNHYFPIDSISGDITVSYNVAPTQEVAAIVFQKDRRLEKLHWGLVPSWAKDLAIASRLINARAETVAQKPSFRAAFKRRRCLILADGFYEWQGDKGSKQPYFITLPSNNPFAFAGLWETWKSRSDSDDEAVYKSCTILTIAASESMQAIHHRMPVVLQSGAYEDWLNPEIQESGRLEDILQNHHARKMQFYPVSKLVNRVQNNSAACIKPITKTEIGEL
jgi:putative SOS response-associated peptidase YedK